MHRPERLRAIVSGFQSMVDAQYDPFLLSAMVIKDMVGEPLSADKKPLIFADGNRRMSLIYARHILEHFGKSIRVDSPRAVKFKEKVRFMNVHEIERWLRTYSMAFKAPLPINSENTRLDIPSNQRSYSSSVIESKYTSPDIYSLWQLHAEGISMEDYNSIAQNFYNAGWWTEARPSKRFKGRFDMYIKRR